MFAIEVKKGIENDVKLFWKAELLPVGDGHLFDTGRIGVS